MNRAFLVVAAATVASTMLATPTDAKGALYQAMVASGCDLEDGKGGRVCYQNVLYLNWCLVGAGLPLPGPLPCVEISDQALAQEEYAEYNYGAAEATSATTCEELSTDGLKFAHNNQPGFETICGASKIPDPNLGSYDEVEGDTKSVGSCPEAMTFNQSEALCSAVGARLCTSEELDNNVAAGTGCGLDSRKNFCWASDGCLANCAHNDAAYVEPQCDKADDEVAWVRCCGDDDKRGEARVANVCKAAVCGASCAVLDGCGWSSARGRCVEGGSTNKQEMNQGDCSGIDRVEAQADPDDPCAQFTCGITCKYADSGIANQTCGWSTNKNACVLGSTTNKKENFLGPGCPVTPAPTLTDKERCKTYTCGATCAQDPACGWSSAKSKCKKGGKVGKLELRAGTDCPTDIETNMPSNDDPCSAYLCGIDCAAHEDHPDLECGWSKGWGMCREGYQTSPQDLNRCVAGVTLPPTTVTKTKATTASTTTTVWGNRKFCHQAQWYTECKKIGPPCKWFGRMKSETGVFRGACLDPNPHPTSPTTTQTSTPTSTTPTETTPTLTPTETSTPTTTPSTTPTSSSTTTTTTTTTVVTTTSTSSTSTTTASSTTKTTKTTTTTEGAAHICAVTYGTKTDCNGGEGCDWDDATASCGLEGTGCINLKAGQGKTWKDSDSDGCDVYVEKEYCNADGSFGVRWGVDKTFLDYAVDGKGANHVCCACGGGRPRCSAYTKKGKCIVGHNTEFSHCKWKWSDRTCFARDQINFDNLKEGRTDTVGKE